MVVGVFPAFKDPNGEWRFVLMVKDDSGENGKIIFGTENSEDGMLEPKFRKVLSEDFNLTPGDVDRAVLLAKREKRT
jgi:hypothetical protein